MKHTTILISALTLGLVLAGCSAGSAAPATQAPATQAPAQTTAAPTTAAPTTAAQTTAAQTTAAAPAASEKPAEAQGFVPTKDIEFVVGAKAGGGADMFARKAVEIIQKYNMVPVNMTVVNKPGSSHVIGYTYLNENNDDHHIGVVSASFYTQPISGNSPFTFDDFSYVSLMCRDPEVLLCSNDSGFNSFEDVLAYEKEHPGELTFAGSSALSDDAVLCELLNYICGTEFTYVAMESGADVVTNLMGGHVELGASGPSEVGDNVVAGNLKALAVTAEQPLEIEGLKGVPTFLELGYDITHQNPRGFVMPKGASPEAVKYFSDIMGKVAETEEWKQYMADNCMAEKYLDCDGYKEFNQEIVDTYTKAIEIIMAKEG